MSAEIIRGEDILLEYTITNEDKTPYDLTGKVIVVKGKIGSTLDSFSDASIIETLPVKGKFACEIPRAKTEQMKSGTELKPEYWDSDVYITDSNGDNLRIVLIRKQTLVLDRQR